MAIEVDNEFFFETSLPVLVEVILVSFALKIHVISTKFRQFVKSYVLRRSSLILAKSKVCQVALSTPT